jgi:hypothetical protein
MTHVCHGADEPLQPRWQNLIPSAHVAVATYHLPMSGTDRARYPYHTRVFFTSPYDGSLQAHWGGTFLARTETSALIVHERVVAALTGQIGPEWEAVMETTVRMMTVDVDKLTAPAAMDALRREVHRKDQER